MERMYATDTGYRVAGKGVVAGRESCSSDATATLSRGRRVLGVGMADARKCEDMDRIREQIARDEYEVDPDAVAQAIVARLLAGRSLRPERA